jgi:hypothetical protein
VLRFSGVELRDDPVALARIDVQTFGGSIASVRATGAGGSPVALSVHGGALTPRTPVTPGERISVEVVVKRPGWSGWALGSKRHETLTVVAPVVSMSGRWVTARNGRVTVRFDGAIDHASVTAHDSTVAGRTVSFPVSATAGSTKVAATSRTWERLGPSQTVTWFPPSTRPVVLADPRPGAQISPGTPLRLTFSQPIRAVLGSKRPTLSERVTGTWVETDSHTLVFEPSGYGAPFDADLKAHLPAPVDVVGTGTAALVSWQVAPASFLRLQQLLAEEGYLPLDWTPDTTDAAHTVRGEMAAAVTPPAGRFYWRFQSTPRELTSLWKAGEPNTIVRGAVMMFEHGHHLAVDGIAGPQVWRAVLADAAAGRRQTSGYSYVYVHRNVPQLLTLWHNGKIVLTSPGNTGVPAAPTALGTFPVFEHIPVGRMSGRNPDGSKYDDPGIRWISYFHRGEALHAFTRASFGTPQSLGCVELPLATAAKVWPYTPIGTLVTIED